MEANMAFLTRLVVDEKYLPGPGVTYCNMALNAFAKHCGCDKIDGLTANQICDLAESDPDFTKESDPDRVVAHVGKGGFAFAGKKYPEHGHVAAIFPSPLVYSGSWKCSVCMVANVGKKNGIMPASLAFPVAEGKPTYYLWKVGTV